MVFFYELEQVHAVWEHKNSILVYASMLAFNLIHSTTVFLYSQKTSKISGFLKSLGVKKRDQWYEMC